MDVDERYIEDEVDDHGSISSRPRKCPPDIVSDLSNLKLQENATTTLISSHKSWK
jgi:hypothetical protein